MAEMTCIAKKENGIFHLEIKHPPFNLLNQQIRKELGDIFIGLQSNLELKTLIFGSLDNSFSAGADLKEFPLRFDPSVARKHGENAHRMIFSLASLCRPVVAVMSGRCLGGGLELAMACGYRIATDETRIGLPEIKRGVWPGTGGIFLLERLIGASQARRLLMSGKTISSLEAFDLGLVDQVVRKEDLDESVMSLAQEFSSGPISSINSISILLDKSFLADFSEHLKYELELFIKAYQLPSAVEGNKAFFDKRTPNW